MPGALVEEGPVPRPGWHSHHTAMWQLSSRAACDCTITSLLHDRLELAEGDGFSHLIVDHYSFVCVSINCQ